MQITIDIKEPLLYELLETTENTLNSKDTSADFNRENFDTEMLIINLICDGMKYNGYYPESASNNDILNGTASKEDKEESWPLASC